MPSSLAVIHSSTSGFSPRPPVSVYGTGSVTVIRSGDFLAGLIACAIRSPVGSRYFRVSVALPPLNRPFRPPAAVSLPGLPFPPSRRLRILDRISIGYPSRVSLRPRLTLIRLALIRNPWAVGARVLPRVVVTHAYIFFSGRSSGPPGPPSSLSAMLPYHCTTVQSLASVPVFMPVHHPRVTARLVSCYALFK